MPILIITEGEQEGTTFELAKRPLSLGRDPSRDIQILDQRVSRKQAMIRHDGTTHVLSPMRSTNPMRLNGEEVQGDMPLSDGDEIAIGGTVLHFTTQTPTEYTNAVNDRKIASRDAREANTIM